MTFETVIVEMFERFPYLREKYEQEFDYLADEAPLAYVVFGSVLMSSLEESLDKHDLRGILSICAYLEDVAESSKSDGRLRNLMKVEVGEWLEVAANEELLSPWLGTETKQMCRYVPGLATQRRNMSLEQTENRVSRRVGVTIRKLIGR
jgi:hypothetical protein